MKDASMEVGNASMGTVHCPKLPIETHQSTDPKLSGMISTNQPGLYWEYFETLRFEVSNESSPDEGFKRYTLRCSSDQER